METGLHHSSAVDLGGEAGGAYAIDVASVAPGSGTRYVAKVVVRQLSQDKMFSDCLINGGQG